MSKHYVCGVDYQHELEECLADVYDSVEALKSARKCWKQCGIVEFTLDEKGQEVGNGIWIEKQDMYWGMK
jgi:hypothetical protein